MSAGASKNARLPKLQVQGHTHAGVAPSARARYNRLIHFEGRSSVVEQRPFKPKVVGSIPTAPTNISFVNNDFWIVEGPRGAISVRPPAPEALGEQLYCLLLEAPWELLACRYSSSFEYPRGARVPVAP